MLKAKTRSMDRGWIKGLQIDFSGFLYETVQSALAVHQVVIMRCLYHSLASMESAG